MITINGIEWEIFLVSPTHPYLIRSDGVKVLGCCDNIDKAIYINELLDNFYLKKVICHEITHAAMFSYNVTLTHDQEELVADLIATYGQEIVYMTNLIFNKLVEYK